MGERLRPVLILLLAVLSPGCPTKVYEDIPPPSHRISVSSKGEQADGDSGNPVISSNGRFVAFQSKATNLVPGDTNGVIDIFLRDRSAGVTTRVSVSSTGSQATGNSTNAAISGDGRFVAFVSTAADLVAGDTNGVADIFVRDASLDTTVRVSVSSAGVEATGSSRRPAISIDGRYVVFESDAANLVPGDTNGVADIYVHDLLSATTTRVSVDSAGNQFPMQCTVPAISWDGRLVAFETNAAMDAGDTNGATDVLIRDMIAQTTVYASVSSAGAIGDRASYSAAFSGDGRSLAFSSYATNLDGLDPDYQLNIFLRDLVAGTTELIFARDQLSYQNCTDASVSTSGHTIVFETTFVTQTGSSPHILVWKRGLGFVPDATPDGFNPSVSGDGRWVAYQSDNPFIVSNDTNGFVDIFVAGPQK